MGLEALLKHLDLLGGLDAAVALVEAVQVGELGRLDVVQQTPELLGLGKTSGRVGDERNIFNFRRVGSLIRKSRVCSVCSVCGRSTCLCVVLERRAGHEDAVLVAVGLHARLGHHLEALVELA